MNGNRKPSSRRAVAACLLASMALLGACTSNLAVTEPETASMATQSLPEMPPAWTSARERLGDVNVGWMDAFDDPLLDALFKEALQNNRNLRAAAANVRRAKAFARQAGAARLPNIDAVGGTQRQEPLEGVRGTTSYSLGAQLSWEVDIWNRVGSNTQAAIESARSAEAGYIFSQYSIAAAVAQSYFIAIEAKQQVAVAQGVFEALTEIHRIVRLRYRYGFASAYDVSLAKSDLASARDSVETARNGELEALRALEALVGRYPGAKLETPKALPIAPPPPGEGLPAQLLERRPDILAAERSIAAALNSRDAAKAARLPNIQLTGALGGASFELGDLFDPVNIAASLGANVLAPIFDGGARGAQVDITEAELDAAIAAYSDTAITAFREVESALDRGTFIRRRLVALETADVETRNALRLSLLQYKEGEIDLLDVLSIQQRVFGTQSNLLSLKRAQLEQYLELNLALGGDWSSSGLDE